MIKLDIVFINPKDERHDDYNEFFKNIISQEGKMSKKELIDILPDYLYVSAFEIDEMVNFIPKTKTITFS